MNPACRSFSPNWCASIGYRNIAAALAAEMPTSTSASCAWFARRSPNVVASAIAADAPQIATAPPASVPNALPRPAARANAIPAPSVASRITSTASSVSGPRSMICPTVMRAPASTMPSRSSVLDANPSPGPMRGSAPMKFSASPISSAISVSGAP